MRKSEKSSTIYESLKKVQRGREKTTQREQRHEMSDETFKELRELIIRGWCDVDNYIKQLLPLDIRERKGSQGNHGENRRAQRPKGSIGVE